MRAGSPFARPLLVVAAAALAAFATTLSGSGGAASDFETDVLAFLQKHCTPCHNDTDREGDYSLAGIVGEEAVYADTDEWEYVRERVADGDMPPRTRVRPSDDEVRRFLDWGTGFAPLDPEASGPLDPGTPVLRRLNHTEYRNTVRDLLHVDFAVDEFFPADPVGNGFDNQGSTLSIPDLLFEKYLAAAEQIAEHAIVSEDPDHPPRDVYDGDMLEAKAVRGGVAVLSSVGDAVARHAFPRDGEYLVRIRAWGNQAGPEVCRMDFVVDATGHGQIDVPATRIAPETYEMRLTIPKGTHRVGGRFVNDYYRPDDPDPAQRDRNLYVESVEIVGPLDPPPVSRFQTELLERFDESLGKRRLRAMIEWTAQRLWRRPLQPSERKRLERLAGKDARLEESLQFALQAMLSSPNFLFRFEFDDPRKRDQVRDLSDWELATRLSYFLWSTAPDEQLLALAEQGTLHEPKILELQVQRMLLHPRARALADNFASQWLQIRRLEDHPVDADRFPVFDESLREAMRGETLLLFETVLRDDRSVWELIDADYTFVNEPLAKHYGLTDVKGERLRRVSIADTNRRGLLSQGSVLTVTSNPTRTSPVKRGRWVAEVLFGAPPPAPPPGADSLDESPEIAASASLRERLEMHRSNAACAVCHDSLDPLGFGLENFDAIGAWREADEHGFPVDSSGELPDGRAFSGPVELVEVLRQDDAFVRALVERLYVYALGRGIERSDRPILARILAELDPDAPTLREIVRGIVMSDAFRRRRSQI